MFKFSPSALIYSSILAIILLLSLYTVSVTGDYDIVEKFTVSHYAFVVCMMNAVFIISYYNISNKRTNYASWFLIAIFCIFALWNGDYISFGNQFLKMSWGSEYKDYLYPYLSIFAFKSYNIFRFFIWGTATFLVFRLAKEYNVSTNVMAFVFPIVFLLLFSYARASFAMALFFTGLTFIIKRGVAKGIVPALIFYFIAFTAHRSMLVLIAFTPLAFIKLTKKKLLIIIPVLIVLALSMNNIISSVLGADAMQDESLESFNKTSNSYMNGQSAVVYNWKYGLITLLQNSSFFIINIFLLWKIVIKKIAVRDEIRKLLTFTTFILLFASFFLFIGLTGNQLGLNIVGYRFLFMTGIPLTLMLSYMYHANKISFRTLLLVLSFSILYSESYMVGFFISKL